MVQELCLSLKNSLRNRHRPGSSLKNEVRWHPVRVPDEADSALNATSTSVMVSTAVAALRPGEGQDSIRVYQDGDHVITQADGRVRDGVFFNVFRCEDGLVIECRGFASPQVR